MIITYGIIFVVLLACELIYFKIADKCNIIDKPNERSSHSTIVLRGGGIIFTIAMLVWAIYQIGWGVHATGLSGMNYVVEYLPFITGLLLIAGVSFVDDIHSLPDSARLVVQFVAMSLLLWNVGSGLIDVYPVWAVALMAVAGLIVCVGATNVINFMDGINGITAGYALAVLLPLAAINCGSKVQEVQEVQGGFVDQSLVFVSILSVLVFCIFNFRPKGKAKCFAGDVGSIGIAFIMLFLIGKVIIATGDLTYLIFLLVYGVDGVLTICHRIMLHENLGEAHRKHVYQLMANELKIGHVKVSLLYMAMQLVVSLGFIYVCPDNVFCHWMYLIGAFLLLAVAYVLFKKKYYHLHEEYLASLKQ